MYNNICETNQQSRLDAGYRKLGAGALVTQREGMGREEGAGSGWGARVHPWWIHVDVWQNQYQKKKKKSQKI